MEISSSGTSLRTGKSLSRVWLLAGVIILVLLALGAYLHFHKTKPPAVNAGHDITSTQIADSQEKAASTSVENKNYSAAADYYYGAASAAYGNKQYDKAKSLLDDCIKQVPDQYVPWYIYQTLALTAQATGDKSLEKSSLQTAISKASAKKSGADAGTIKIMKQDLQEL